MAYHNKFVVAIRANNKVLRETSDNTVLLPYGTEYSIRLKNLNTVRTLVSITVDGQPATEDIKLVVNANSTVDVDRWIKNGNPSIGNRFKFIERTSNIEKHRGIKEDDGLIRIEYWFEQQSIFSSPPEHHWVWAPPIETIPSPYNAIPPHPGAMWCMNNTAPAPQYSQNTMFKGDSNFVATGIQSSFNNGPGVESTAATVAGITVAGGISNQQFVQSTWFPSESQSHAIILKLVGVYNTRPVLTPITVDSKPCCTTCNKVNFATNKFCSECGTSLILV